MPSSSMMHAVQRHKDVLEDYKRDYARTKVGVGSVAAEDYDQSLNSYLAIAKRGTSVSSSKSLGISSKRYQVGIHSVII